MRAQARLVPRPHRATVAPVAGTGEAPGGPAAFDDTDGPEPATGDPGHA